MRSLALRCSALQGGSGSPREVLGHGRGDIVRQSEHVIGGRGMKKIWGAVALVGCMALWGGALVCADENDEHQGGGAGLTTAQAGVIFHTCQEVTTKTPSPLRKTPGTKMWCAVVDREGELLLIKATDTGGTPSAPGGSDA
jgi:hypothetical protein